MVNGSEPMTESEKQCLRDREILLKKQLSGGIVPTGKNLLLDPDPAPYDSDLREVWQHIFSRENPGFDFIFGNPPYQDTDKTYPHKDKFTKLGFLDVERLEHLFLRLSLSLVKEEGIICQIVPYSIASRNDCQDTRVEFQRNCRKITISSFGNRPSSMFPKNPFLRKDKENRSSPMIMTALKGQSDNLEFLSSPIQRWSEKDREHCIQKDPQCSLPERLLDFPGLNSKWPKISTDRIASMFCSAVQNGTQISRLTKRLSNPDPSRILDVPKTGYLYVSILPHGNLGKFKPKATFPLKFMDSETASIAFLALNTTIHYAWWMAWDDGFHVTASPIRQFHIPDQWLTDPAMKGQALRLSDTLRGLIPAVTRTLGVQGGKSQTLDFFTHTQSKGIVRQGSQLYLQAIGIPTAEQQTLLDELEFLQTNSNWDF